MVRSLHGIDEATETLETYAAAGKKQSRREDGPSGKWMNMNGEILNRIFSLTELKDRGLGLQVKYSPFDVCPRVVYSMVCKHWRAVSLQPGLQDHLSIVVPRHIREARWVERSLSNALKAVTLLEYTDRAAKSMISLEHMIEILAWKAPNLTFLDLPSCNSPQFSEVSLLSSLSNLRHLGLHSFVPSYEDPHQFEECIRDLQKANLSSLKELELEGLDSDWPFEQSTTLRQDHWHALTSLKWRPSHRNKDVEYNLIDRSALHHFLPLATGLRYLKCDLAYIASREAPIMPNLTLHTNLTALKISENNIHLFDKVVQLGTLPLPSSLQKLSLQTEWHYESQPAFPLKLPHLPNLTKLSFRCHNCLKADVVLHNGNEWVRNLVTLCLEGLSDFDATIASLGTQLQALRFLKLDRVLLHSLQSLSCLQSLEHLSIRSHSMQQDNLNFFTDVFCLKSLAVLEFWGRPRGGRETYVRLTRATGDVVYYMTDKGLLLAPVNQCVSKFQQI